MNQSQWYFNEQDSPPQNFIDLIASLTEQSQCDYLAKLLWHRGIRETHQLQYWLNPSSYKPTAYSKWGEDIKLAIQRIRQASIEGETVAIWGKWQVGSIISTCILDEGLKQFLSANNQLLHYFPSRCQSYFGLNRQGIEDLAQQGVSLIITADTGSYNLDKIAYAHSLSIDIIIIDRSEFLNKPSSVVAYLNPCCLPTNHPFYHFTAVAIAYQLIEGLATEYPHCLTENVTNLLDLVALGLLTDTVNLQGDGRYLATKGINLIKQEKRQNLKLLAETIFTIGDRALDIRYGISNRIRGITSVYKDVCAIINLLTTNNMSLRIKLVDQAEKAYFNYLELGQKIIDGLRKKLQSLDLSNTVIIVCENKQWHIGLVKFVAQIINEEYGKPTLLLSANLVGEYADNYVYGYFCSSTNNNLFSLFPESSHLLKQYQVEKEGVHLVLALENISLFTEIITQKIRKSIQPSHLINQINIDLKININEVNQSLYQQLKLLEPYSLDNPLPKLLIENCQLIEVKHSNLYNKFKNKSARFKKTSFKFIDDSTISSVEGIWWGHYAQEIDQNQHYDLIGEVEFNTSENKQYYYFRLLDLKIHHPCNYLTLNKNRSIPILDYRGHRDDLSDSELNADVVKQCPRQWQEIRQPYHNAIADNKTLVLAYEPEQINNTQQLWLELMGMIKYLIKTKKKVTIEQLSDKLKISNKCLLKILSIVDSLLDVQYNFPDNVVIFSAEKKGVSKKQYHLAYQQFVTIIKQENLHKQYFYQVSIQDLNREI